MSTKPPTSGSVACLLGGGVEAEDCVLYDPVGIGDSVQRGVHTAGAVRLLAVFPRMFLAGDMNIGPMDPEVGLFLDSGLVDVVAGTGDPCRTTSAEPTSDCDRPDWVLITRDVEIAEFRIGTGGASDHLAMHVTVVP